MRILGGSRGVIGLAALIISVSCGLAKHTPVTLDPVDPEAASEWEVPSDRECEAWGRSVEELVLAGDMDELSGAIDWEAFLQSVSGGVGADSKFDEGFKKGFRGSLTEAGGLLERITGIVAEGGSYRFLRLRNVDGQKRALFRMIAADSGLNYHDFILVRQPDGRVRARDLYVYLMGETLSRSLRRMYVIGASQSRRSLIDLIVPRDRALIDHSDELVSLTSAINQGHTAEALAIYHRLPPSLQEEKLVLTLRLQAAQQEGDEAYLAAMEDIQRLFPGDPAGDLVLLDRLFMTGEYDLFCQSLDRLDRAVGGDPYLLTLKAGIRAEEGRFEDAERLVSEAIAAEPSLEEAYWSRISFLLRQRRFAQIGPRLDEIARIFDLEISDLTQAPDYSEYVQSPEYDRWQKGRGAAAAGG